MITEQEKTEWAKTLLGKRTPEAVGDILREGYDFYILHEDGKDYVAGASTNEHVVHLRITKGKVEGAAIAV